MGLAWKDTWNTTSCIPCCRTQIFGCTWLSGNLGNAAILGTQEEREHHVSWLNEASVREAVGRVQEDNMCRVLGAEAGIKCSTAAAAKSLQSCPTLCDPRDGSPPGSLVPEIFQARTLEWVAISFSNAWKWKVKVKLLSCVRLLATRWTAAYQVPPSMGFSRHEYWSGMPLPSLE